MVRRYHEASVPCAQTNRQDDEPVSIVFGGAVSPALPNAAAIESETERNAPIGEFLI